MRVGHAGGAESLDGFKDEAERLSRATRAIVDYERQAGISAEDSVLGRMMLEKSGDWRQHVIRYGRKCSERLRYCLEIDRCIDRTKPTWQPVVVSLSTPPALRAAGFPDAPLHHTQKHVRRELSPKGDRASHCHGLTQHQLKRLPELLESPCAIWDNPKGKDGVLVLLDALDDDGLPLVAIIDPGVENRTTGLPCNFVKSVYGMDRAFVRLADAAESRRLLFCDPGKTKRLMSSSSLQLPGSPMNLAPIVRQTRKTVKHDSAYEQGKRGSNSRKENRESRAYAGSPESGAWQRGDGRMSGAAPKRKAGGGGSPAADRARDCSPGRGWRSESRGRRR